MNIELPKKNMKLFESTKRYLDFSHFGWGDIETQFYGYTKGYKESADTLVDYALNSKSIAVLDTYVFPILFLYRQFIELSLKSLYLEYANETIEKKVQVIKEVNHNLHQMWNKLKPTLIDSDDGNSESEIISIAESYVIQFHNFDNSSFKFRYPIDKDYNPLLNGEEQRIDLANLKSRMTELDNFFGGTSGKLSYFKDCKEAQEEHLREVREELRAEFEAEMRTLYY